MKKKLTNILFTFLIILAGCMLSGTESEAATYSEKNPDFKKTYTNYYLDFGIEKKESERSPYNIEGFSSPTVSDSKLVLRWQMMVKKSYYDERMSFTYKQTQNVVEGFEIYIYKDKKWKKLGTMALEDKISKFNCGEYTGWGGERYADCTYYKYKFTYDASKWTLGTCKFKVRPWGYADEQGGKYNKKKVYGEFSEVIKVSVGNYGKNPLKIKSAKSKKAGTISLSYIMKGRRKLTEFSFYGQDCGKLQIYVSTDKKFKKNVKKYSTHTYYYNGPECAGQYDKYGKELSSYTIKGLKKGKTYYVKMRFKRWNRGNQDITYSKWSDVVKVKTKK